MLHCHTIFSFLDGLSSPEALVERASKLHLPALGITDHGTLSGWIRLYKACVSANIKPILGVEGYFVQNAEEHCKERYHLCIFAKNNEGIQEIFGLMSEANRRFYYRPQIDVNLLSKCKNTIVTTACMNGLLKYPGYDRLISVLKDRVDLYLELMPLDIEEQRTINNRAIELSRRMSIPLCITNDVHYADKNQRDAHDFMLRLKTKGKLASHYESLCLLTEDELRSRWIGDKDVFDSAIQGNREIADKCSVKLEPRQIQLPKTSDRPVSQLIRQAETRLKAIGKWQDTEYIQRLIHEAAVVDEKNFGEYFVMVSDLCNWAWENGFERAVGRGSAGGSLLCYLLNITDIDPMKYGLLFERFLNPGRTDWPDIDLDFEDARRQEIIEYLKKKYGEDRVANISTYSRMKAKSAFRDVAKSFGLTPKQTDAISKTIDNDKPLKEQPISHDHKDWDKIATYTDALTGCLRQPGKHAAGLVISSAPLKECCALEHRGDTSVVGWDMDDASYMGLVKLDVLGLRTLSIISHCKKLIEEEINWDTIDLSAQEILDQFAQGHTIGIMQFGSPLQISLLRDLAPITDIQTIIDSNALGRPGPLDSGMMREYIDRKKGVALINKNKPYERFTRKVTNETYGVIVYQEQIIAILRDVAGYSIAQADSVRRVIAKSKGLREMEAHRNEFIQGCMDTSKMDAKTADALFSDLVHYSRYSFNKSHAAAYTLTAMRQMYLKVHYPAEYMASLMSETDVTLDNQDNFTQFRKECERLGIPILPPDINLSDSGFMTHNGAIITGFAAVKGIGPKAVEAILKAREEGTFRSYEDFCVRCPKSQVNKTALNALMTVGAFSDRSDTQYTIVSTNAEQDKAALLGGLYEAKVNPSLDMQMEKLYYIQDCIRNCRACPLWGNYKCPVVSDFTDRSKIMVIGEAPGRDEVAEGKPFVGRAGKLLLEGLRSIGIRRNDLYISNVYHCRPMDNKLPDNTPTVCHKYLRAEIKVAKPSLILALGNTPLAFLKKQKGGISHLNGTAETIEVAGHQTTVVYAIHPSAALRSKENLRTFNAGLMKLKEILS